jgi:hypothetical protein
MIATISAGLEFLVATEARSTRLDPAATASKPVIAIAPNLSSRLFIERLLPRWFELSFGKVRRAFRMADYYRVYDVVGKKFAMMRLSLSRRSHGLYAILVTFHNS